MTRRQRPACRNVSDTGSPRLRTRGILKLGIAVVAITIIWGYTLPRVAMRPQMQSHQKWLDDRGIDPSAMYYTELEAMKPILQRIERNR